MKEFNQFTRIGTSCEKCRQLICVCEKFDNLISSPKRNITITLIKDLPNCPKGRKFKQDMNGDFFHSMTDDESINNIFKRYFFTKEEVRQNLEWFSFDND